MGERTGEGRDGLVAAIFVDLDDFKLVNDSLGHDAGDQLLLVVAERLRRALRPEDLLSRFGGDEFAVGLTGLADESGARRVADRLAGALGAPIEVAGHSRFVTASFGLRCVPAAEASTEDLLRDADSAMYRAKAMGKARCEAFDQTMHEQALERLDLEGGLRDAIDGDELFLVYQPQVSLPAGKIVSVEALVRWEHPRRGTLLPNSFIPLAEQSGLIGLLGGWTLREACRQGAEWARTGHPLRVSVNVSPRQLAAPGFVAEVAAALHAAGHEPSLLCLEITESAVLAEPERVAETLERLKALGVRLALDDFGVGYSSLAQLRSLLPVDELKIDRSFVSGMTVGHEDRAIVDAVVRLATLLGMEAVAEGVETSEQAGALLEVDCARRAGLPLRAPGAGDRGHPPARPRRGRRVRHLTPEQLARAAQGVLAGRHLAREGLLLERREQLAQPRPGADPERRGELVAAHERLGRRRRLAGEGLARACGRRARRARRWPARRCARGWRRGRRP